MKTYAIIPARAGSKGIKNKNIQRVNGKELIAYSIEVALKVKEFDRVIVSTDSEEIAELSLSLGAEVPFLRPEEYAQDTSPDRAYLLHALSCFEQNDKVVPELMAILRPTTPLRDRLVLSQAVYTMRNKFNEATSLRSVHGLPEPPQKMLQMIDGWLTGFFPDDPREDYFNLPRQSFPTAYQPNGYIDIVKTEYIKSENEKIFGDKMIGHITPNTVEIDTLAELQYLKYLVKKSTHG